MVKSKLFDIEDFKNTSNCFIKLTKANILSNDDLKVLLVFSSSFLIENMLTNLIDKNINLLVDKYINSDGEKNHAR